MESRGQEVEIVSSEKGEELGVFHSHLCMVRGNGISPLQGSRTDFGHLIFSQSPCLTGDL